MLKIHDRTSQGIIGEVHGSSWHHEINYERVLKESSVFYSGCSLPYFSKLKLSGIFPAVYSVNTNLPEKRVQPLLSKK